MNSKQRVDAVIRGQIPDRVPVCLHNFLPAVEEAGMRLEDYLSDPSCAAKAHLQAVEKYGHDCILIDLDTTMIAEAMGARFARPYQERLVKDLAADGLFTTIHVCGNTSAIVDQFAEYPWCGFELDYKTDAARAKDTAGAGHVLFGNIDPSGVIGRGTAAQVRAAAEELIRIWNPGGRFILNSGCAIPPGTPPENIAALVACAKEFGSY